MTTSHDVIAMLRRHYLPEGRPPGGVFAPEIGAPDQRRRADLIWLPTTIAGGNGLVGHEVKVSRSDVMTELADPTKAESWAQYCTRWWLVVSDPHIIAGLEHEVPDAWGIMAPPSGRRTRTMTVLRPAPKLDPPNPAPGLHRLAAWQLYRTADTVREAEHKVAMAEGRVTGLERQLDEVRAAAGGAGWSSPHLERVQRILRRVQEDSRRHYWWGADEATDDAVVEAILDRLGTREAAQQMRSDLRSLVYSVEQLVAPLAHVKPALAKAERAAAALVEGGVA